MTRSKLIPRLLGVVAAGALAAACGSTPEAPADVRPLIAAQLAGNALGVRPDELKQMPNPRGEGQLVYVERTLFDAGERFLVWLVLDAQAYTINGQTHNLTPALPFPRAAPEERWRSTGLDPGRATETLELVFGKR